MPPSLQTEFLALAGELAMLPRESLQALAAEAERREVAASQLVLRKGLLNAAQVDIVETMLRPEESIPGYEILGLLGHGGMGVVYRARQKNLDREVALKTVLVSQMGSAAAAARFEKEAVAVGRLRHPNVVAAYDFGRHEERLFFAMELVEGEDLESRIASGGAVSESWAWAIARQVASGLAHAHEQGIVHRDVKPANLLLVDPPAGYALPPGVPMVKIADFGLAFLAADEQLANTRLTRADTTLGSPQYMAPEQLKASSVDHRADVYALGATVFFMLAGRSPFEGLALSQIYAAKLGGQMPRLDAVSPSVSEASARLVAELMAADPEQRVADYARLIQRIDALPCLAEGVVASNAVTSSRGRPVLRSSEDTREFVSAAAAVRTREIPVPPGPRDDEQPDGRTSVIPRKRSPRRWLAAGLLAAAAVCGGVAIWSVLFRGEDHIASDASPPPGPRDLVPTGRTQFLFDGVDMTAWQQRSGGWTIAEHEELGNVLEGSGGQIVRGLPRSQAAPSPPEHYRLSLALQLHQADAAEVQFGIEKDSASPRAGGPRYVLRLEEHGVTLGRRPGESPELTVLAKPFDGPVTRDALHFVEVERQREDWWLSFDGQALGHLKVRPGPYQPEFRLTVEGPGRAAFFSDVQIEELAQP